MLDEVRDYLDGLEAGVDVWSEQQRLATRLGGWALGSVAGGTAVAVMGAHRTRPMAVAFGRQTAAWGAIDGGIAAVGEWRRRRRLNRVDPEDPDVVEAERASLRRLLLVNAALDVVYVVGGAVLAARPEAVARRTGGRRDAAAVRGDGLAVVVQGGFLLWLDVTGARRLSAGAGH